MCFQFATTTRRSKHTEGFPAFVAGHAKHWVKQVGVGHYCWTWPTPGARGCGSKLTRRGTPRALVHVSTYQGSNFGTGFFEPQPHGRLHAQISSCISPANKMMQGVKEF